MHEQHARWSDRKQAFRQSPRFKTKKEIAAQARAKQRKRDKLKKKRKERAKEQVRVWAQEMRTKMTPAENALWQRLRQWERPFLCKAQHPIAMKIADFAFCEQHMIVEVDGGYHLTAAQRTADHFRTKDLERAGFKVVRFTNEQVMNRLDDVVEAISVGIGRTATPEPPELQDYNLWSDPPC